MINLWLDDVRPAPAGWVHCKTVEEAIGIFERNPGHVVNASLDHDLGHNEAFGLQLTGYDLVCWMEANDCWPINKPTVHSMNPVGRARMQQVIDREYD